jgi:hypothetical protein
MSKLSRLLGELRQQQTEHLTRTLIYVVIYVIS